MSLAGMLLAGDDHVPGSTDEIITSCMEVRLSPGWHTMLLTYLSPRGAHHSYLRMSMHEPQSVDERYPGRYVIHYDEVRACARGSKASSGNDCAAPLPLERFRTCESAVIVGDAAPSAAPSARKSLFTASLTSEQSGSNAAVLHDSGAVRRLAVHSTSSDGSAPSSDAEATQRDAAGSVGSVATTAASSGERERSSRARGSDGRARDEREPRETDRERQRQQRERASSRRERSTDRMPGNDGSSVEATTDGADTETAGGARGEPAASQQRGSSFDATEDPAGDAAASVADAEATSPPQNGSTGTSITATSADGATAGGPTPAPELPTAVAVGIAPDPQPVLPSDPVPGAAGAGALAPTQVYRNPFASIPVPAALDPGDPAAASPESTVGTSAPRGARCANMSASFGACMPDAVWIPAAAAAPSSLADAPSAAAPPVGTSSQQPAVPPLPAQPPCSLAGRLRACMGRQRGTPAVSTMLTVDCSQAFDSAASLMPQQACVYESSTTRPAQGACGVSGLLCTIDRDFEVSGAVQCTATPALDAQGPRVLELTVELRSWRPGAGPWGVAVAAIDLLVVVVGAAHVVALEALPAHGSSQGVVKMGAALQYPTQPPEAHGLVSLKTSAHVDGIGAHLD